ncbi:MAG: hypothetical protein JXA33_19500 [Anaerolineae bacterium]|nr:hypothetical protein [Anaerolineae bacterium]
MGQDGGKARRLNSFLAACVCKGYNMSSTVSKNIILEQVSQIRSFINNPRKHYELRQNKAMFSQLCSSFDIIEDTEEAIIAYTTMEFREDKSVYYLCVYGLLQAIYVQQDAVINLSESLGLPEKINTYPVLKDIREARNDIVGHPTKRDQRKGQPTSYHHISRITLSQSGFQLISYFADGSSPQFRNIDLQELITKQREFISKILGSLITQLEAEGKAHKARFRMEKLVDIFPSTLGYNFEKIFEGIHRDDYAEFADLNLQQIQEIAYNFREAVKKRNMDFYESLQEEYELLEYARTHLNEYYLARTNGEEAKTEIPTVKIFADFLQRQLDTLRTYAQEIDQDYAQ